MWIMMTAVPEDPTELATETLLLVILDMSGHFKYPTVYVLQDKCKASVQCQTLKVCISLLHTVEINMLALVFDGCFTIEEHSYASRWQGESS